MSPIHAKYLRLALPILRRLAIAAGLSLIEYLRAHLTARQVPPDDPK
jgi:hypothetical protein